MKIIESGSFFVDEIVVEGRLREVNADHAAVIAATVKATGLLQHPITIRKNGNRLVLVAGAHRLAAFKLLGRTSIPAQLVEPDEGQDAKTIFNEIEIVENVGRNDLSALDRAIHLGELLKIHEARGYSRKAGRPGKTEIGKTFPDFHEAAEKLQVSRRSINQYLALYKDLSPAAIARLKGTDLADNFSELRKLAAEEKTEQVAIITEALDGERRLSISVAIALHFNKVDTTTPDERHMAAFMKLWGKATPKTRKRMLAWGEANLKAKAPASKGKGA